MTKTVFVIFLCLFLIACASRSTPRPGDPFYAPVVMPSMPAAPTTAGSLYSENSAFSLFSDQKASRVGDLVTIVLSEQTVSNKSANVGVSKNSEVSIPEPTILGGAVTLNGRGLATSLGGDRNFDGSAGAKQSNSLRGNITVTVVDIWPNGTLVVRGEKWMTLNRGDELIRISGLVRPTDVSKDNEVQSTKIANARITYAGTGELASSQGMGIVSRFFNSDYWLF
ncbi:MAG: flagellar basal body L-ring protein FlgH [Marinagarivorans sp.]|nr:flagellar basal body L-ring protein FlgH [Marinagarivorans sp.]